MALSHDLISQFAKLVNSNQTTKTGTTMYGTVRVDDSGNKYVQLDGSDQLTPLTDTSANAKAGQRVSVLIKDHSAIVTGNTSSPSATTGELDDLETKVDEFEYVIVGRIEADEAYITELQADVAKIGELEAAYAEIEELVAGKISAEELEAELIKVEELIAQKIEAALIEADYATIAELEAVKATITNLDAKYATIEQLNAVNATIENLDAKYATIEQLNAVNATIEQLNAEVAKIGSLEADVGYIKDLMFDNAAGTTISAEFANLVGAAINSAVIKDAAIQSVSAGKITAGQIATNLVSIGSVNDDGGLLLADKTIQITDANKRVRVQIGKDASNDYSINIWDVDGKLMFSEGGITGDAIKEAIIRNDMIPEGANINAAKLDIASLFEQINGSTYTLKSSRIYFDDTNQSLNAVFQGIKQEVDENGNAIGAVESSVASLTASVEGLTSTVSQQTIDIDTLSTNYSKLEQTVSGITTTVSDHDVRISDTEIRMETAESKIEQNAEAISMRVRYDEALLDSVVIGQGSQEVTVNTAIPDNIKNISILGKTVQNGVPTPTAPVYFTNAAGDGNADVIIKVADTETSITVPTPNGLPGIPIPATFSNYDYIDSAGQKWRSDKIDLERGVYIQRYNTVTFDGTEEWELSSTGYPVITGLKLPAVADSHSSTDFANYMCSHFKSVAADDTLSDGSVYCYTENYIRHLSFVHAAYTGNLSGWKQWLTDQAAAGTPVTMLLGRYTPIETEIADAPDVPSVPSGEIIITSDANLMVTLSEIASAKRVAYAESEIKQLADSITMMVSDADGTSLIEQTSDGWKFKLSDIVGELNENSSDLDALYDYITIDSYKNQPCITLGESENGFKLRITNTEIHFTGSDGETIPAYISNEKLMIEQAEVTDELQFGPGAGRNLLPRSNFTAECTTITMNSESGYGFIAPGNQTGVSVPGMVEGLNLATNTQYTVSFTAWLDTTDSNAKQSLTWDLWPDNLPQEFIYADENGITNIPRKYSWTIISDQAEMSNCNLRFIVFEQDSEGYTAKYPVYITDIKLEEGPRATKWSAAPEDGNAELHGSWIWKRRSNGNLGLAWKDVII